MVTIVHLKLCSRMKAFNIRIDPLSSKRIFFSQQLCTCKCWYGLVSIHLTTCFPFLKTKIGVSLIKKARNIFHSTCCAPSNLSIILMMKLSLVIVKQSLLPKLIGGNLVLICYILPPSFSLSLSLFVSLCLSLSLSLSVSLSLSLPLFLSPSSLLFCFYANIPLSFETYQCNGTRLDGEGIIKVADFGLSKHLYGKLYFREDTKDEVKFPFKWMAIESLQDGVFSERTDVVSAVFGDKLPVVIYYNFYYNNVFCLFLQSGHLV